MIDAFEAKNNLLAVVSELDKKHELSKTITPDYYEPGNMENLEQYLGEYITDENAIRIRVDVKGLRYEKRTEKLKRVRVGDPVNLVRDASNEYNQNNFNVVLEDGFVIGTLPAGICNVIAPLFDAEYLSIERSNACYIEQITERSRYARQGILFVEVAMKLMI